MYHDIPTLHYREGDTSKPPGPAAPPTSGTSTSVYPPPNIQPGPQIGSAGEQYPNPNQGSGIGSAGEMYPNQGIGSGVHRPESGGGARPEYPTIYPSSGAGGIGSGAQPQVIPSYPSGDRGYSGYPQHGSGIGQGAASGPPYPGSAPPIGQGVSAGYGPSPPGYGPSPPGYGPSLPTYGAPPPGGPSGIGHGASSGGLLQQPLYPNQGAPGYDPYNSSKRSRQRMLLITHRQIYSYSSVVITLYSLYDNLARILCIICTSSVVKVKEHKKYIYD
ncbi:hypothetical protein Aduo_008317 [Ancylostoma duodenale]